ncbi:unnamed protein product [Vicia faba]|uniref:Uncharacterized protein n=1 Tax=Vicia faba TaxID=3906 RepID=A0AAV0Z6E4_VICFA|nr:unnamed protein product [Vicia faba]
MEDFPFLSARRKKGVRVKGRGQISSFSSSSGRAASDLTEEKRVVMESFFCSPGFKAPSESRRSHSLRNQGRKKSSYSCVVPEVFKTFLMRSSEYNQVKQSRREELICNSRSSIGRKCINEFPYLGSRDRTSSNRDQCSRLGSIPHTYMKRRREERGFPEIKVSRRSKKATSGSNRSFGHSVDSASPCLLSCWQKQGFRPYLLLDLNQ